MKWWESRTVGASQSSVSKLLCALAPSVALFDAPLTGDSDPRVPSSERGESTGVNGQMRDQEKAKTTPPPPVQPAGLSPRDRALHPGRAQDLPWHLVQGLALQVHPEVQGSPTPSSREKGSLILVSANGMLLRSQNDHGVNMGDAAGRFLPAGCFGTSPAPGAQC